MTHGKHHRDHADGNHEGGKVHGYQGYKVPAGEVTKDGLAKILYTMSTKGHDKMPATVIDNWNANPELNTWRNELSDDPTTLTWDEANVGATTNRALSEFVAWVSSGHSAKQPNQE